MPVEIVEYDHRWPARYAREAVRIAAALGPLARRIEHVGSTSVPGLAAKDIIDIQLSVESFDDAYRAPLEQLGYVFRPDDEPAHRFFYLPDPARAGRKLVHIHVCLSGSEWEAVHPRFRDLLRADGELRAAYERLKRDLAPRFEVGNDYADAKGPFIRGALARGTG